jgi:hypothetical protein
MLLPFGFLYAQDFIVNFVNVPYEWLATKGHYRRHLQTRLQTQH